MFMRDEDKGKSIALRISEFLPVIWLVRNRPVVAWLIFNASSVSSGYQMSISHHHHHHHYGAWCLSVPLKAFVIDNICSSSIEPHQWRSSVRNFSCRVDEIPFLRKGLTMMMGGSCVYTREQQHMSRVIGDEEEAERRKNSSWSRTGTEGVAYFYNMSGTIELDFFASRPSGEKCSYFAFQMLTTVAFSPSLSSNTRRKRN